MGDLSGHRREDQKDPISGDESSTEEEVTGEVGWDASLLRKERWGSGQAGEQLPSHSHFCSIPAIKCFVF